MLNSIFFFFTTILTRINSIFKNTICKMEHVSYFIPHIKINSERFNNVRPKSVELLGEIFVISDVILKV